MLTEKILEQLSDIIRDILDEPDVPITRDTTAEGVPGWDSVNHINIVVGAEVRFGVKFRTAELDEIKNVGDFVDVIAKKMAK